jgi:hypothetical protein
MFTMNGVAAGHGVGARRLEKTLLYQPDMPPIERSTCTPKALRDGQKAPGARSFLPARARVETRT